MATPLNNSAWLEWMETLMGGMPRQSPAAAFPPDSFYCLLDDLPLHLVPQRARKLLPNAADHIEMEFNPECMVCSPGEIPEELDCDSELLSRFTLNAKIVWVRSTSTSRLQPFWLGPELADLIVRLQRRNVAPSSIPADTKSVLFAAGILIPKDRAAESGERTFSNASRMFREKGYAPVADLIHPFHIAALRRYYRHMIRSGAIRLGDYQSARRYAAHNEPVARFFHHQITPALSAIAGEPLKPSYVYLASYLSGAELKKHTDREQCEFSITLCLDFSPEPELATSWPICLDTLHGTVTVHQALGDALAYRGTRLPHYRRQLAPGQTSTSIFFHYVRADYQGPLE